jgi:hypothetical protein
MQTAVDREAGQEQEPVRVRIERPIRTGFLMGVGFAVILPIVLFIVGLLLGIVFVAGGGF